MSGLCALSVDSATYMDDFLEDLFWGTFYQQHLGEQFCGMSVWDGKKIHIRTYRGLLKPNFDGKMGKLIGSEGIGYCGLAREPFRIDSKIGRMSLCFSGNIANRADLVSSFEKDGHIFERGDDIEVIAKLIGQEETMISGLAAMMSSVKGSFALLILNQDTIYAVVSPDGHWPLVIGKKKGAVIVTSESGGFKNLGFDLSGDVNPGEILIIKKAQLERQERVSWATTTPQICSFLWVYTAFPNARIRGLTASLVRKNLGALLARRDISLGFIPDVVVPVPDSGRFHAIGYHQEFCRQMNRGKIAKVPVYDEVLLKYPFAGRSYTQKTQEARNREAAAKLLEDNENGYSGRTVVVCDDSIVRGTQTQSNLVPKLERVGFGEIHLRISFPELVSHCPWGKTTKKGELIATRLPSIEDRIKFLGVKSLKYNTINDLDCAIEGIYRENLCMDCAIRRD